MRTARVSDMTKGWFIGDFSPTLERTRAVEVAVKHYRAGESERAHYHKIAREFTVVVSGAIRMNGREFTAGDIVVVEPGEVAEFAAVTDAVTTVVKLPGAPDDKFFA